MRSSKKMDPRGAKRVALCGSRYSSTAVLPQLLCFVVLAAVNGEYRRFEGFAFRRLPGSNNKRETFSISHTFSCIKTPPAATIL